MCVREGRVTTISNFKTIVIIRKISAFHFILKLLERNSVHYKFHDGLQLLQYKGRFFDLFLNIEPYSALRDKQLFFIWVLNVARLFLFLLGVIAELEDDKGIPSSILPVKDDLVFS